MEEYVLIPLNDADKPRMLSVHELGRDNVMVSGGK